MFIEVGSASDYKRNHNIPVVTTNVALSLSLARTHVWPVQISINKLSLKAIFHNSLHFLGTESKFTNSRMSEPENCHFNDAFHGLLRR